MNIPKDALQFSINHINRYYDSDFFPKLSEYVVINTRWNDVVSYLNSLDIENYRPFTANAKAAPKSDGGFRIVHQLDPIDTLIYTSFSYLVAESVEKCRPVIEDGVSCSYRFHLDPKGTFFDERNGYLQYVDRSRQLSEKYPYVLLCDIAAFYNHIYVHRLQNIIEGCDPSLQKLSKIIEDFIIGLNNGASSGIPVGPAASIIMSETILLDVDNFLSRFGIEFVRYADDIRIFSQSKNQLLSVLSEFVEFLHNIHRLSLSSSKTRIITSEIFKTEIIDDPENIEKQAIHDKLSTINLKVNMASNYDFVEPIESMDELPSNDQVKVQAQVLEETIQNIAKMKKLDLGLARHIIRRSKRLRTRSIYKCLLENFDFFTPVLRDVILYLEAVSNKKAIEINMDLFENIVSTSIFRDTPYIKDWLCYLFSKEISFQKSPIIKEYLRNCTYRYRILGMKNHYGLSWLRSQKTSYDQLSLQDKRALLCAVCILPKDEKRAWLKNLSPTSDYLEKNVA